MKEILVDEKHRQLKSVDGVVYDRALKTLIRCPGGKTGSYEALPTTVTIATLAFENCSNLTTVQLPQGLKMIGDMSFRGCEGLTHIYLPSTLASFGYSAFAGCSGLTSITIPASVDSIARYAFSRCDSLTEVYFQGDAPKLEDNVFSEAGDNFGIYFKQGQSGFTFPDWHGHPVQRLPRDDPRFNRARAVANTITGDRTRVWTDATGQYSVEAEFVSLSGNVVTLLKPDGEVAKLALDRLGATDQDLVRKLAVGD
ncbi:hypothetical protein BH23VER1_BH23VER1_29790 [soil metagenome]